MMTTETTKENQVLEFLKRELKTAEHTNSVLCYYGVGAKDLVKYLEHPKKCGNWLFDFVILAEESVNKINNKYLIPFPIIENQTEQDRVLSKLLSKNNWYCFGTNAFFNDHVKVSHVIQYMERQGAIYDWTAYFLLRVQAETKRVKEFLL